jgi:hypothetical protein
MKKSHIIENNASIGKSVGLFFLLQNAIYTFMTYTIITGT